MNKKTARPLSFLCLWLLAAVPAVAQSYWDIARFGQRSYGSTARAMGMGGAVGSMGGDLAGLSINPASMALYRRSASTLSLGLEGFNNRSTYFGHTDGESVIQMTVPSLGLVFANEQMRMGAEVEEGWKFINFGFGMNRHGSHRGRQYFEGTNRHTSILDEWTALAQGYYPDELLSPDLQFEYPSLGYQTGLIFPFNENDNVWYNIVDSEGHTELNLRQGDFFETHGARNEYFASVGGNYNDKLYLGMNVALQSIRYNSLRQFVELNRHPEREFYSSTTLEEGVNMRGTGFSAHLGAIYAFTPFFRAGVAAQTPTFYRITENYSSFVEGRRMPGHGGPYSVSTPEAQFRYNLTTPWRLNTSATWLVPAVGGNQNRQMLLNADVEYVAWPGGRLSSRDYNYRFENAEIRNNLRRSMNFRTGAELKMGMAMLRAGYGYTSSAIRPELLDRRGDFRAHTFAFGGGLREQDFYLDLGLSYMMTGYGYYPYTVPEGFPEEARNNVARMNDSRFTALLTIGTFF